MFLAVWIEHGTFYDSWNSNPQLSAGCRSVVLIGNVANYAGVISGVCNVTISPPCIYDVFNNIPVQSIS